MQGRSCTKPSFEDSNPWPKTTRRTPLRHCPQTSPSFRSHLARAFPFDADENTSFGPRILQKSTIVTTYRLPTQQTQLRRCPPPLITLWHEFSPRHGHDVVGKQMELSLASAYVVGTVCTRPRRQQRNRPASGDSISSFVRCPQQQQLWRQPLTRDPQRVSTLFFTVVAVSTTEPRAQDPPERNASVRTIK